MVPFALSIIQWLKNFHLYNEDGTVNTKEGVDVLKTTIGILGVARQLMYNSAAVHPGFKGFTLFNEANRDWDDRFRNNIVGGPSVIYSLHHKAGRTCLRDQEKGKLFSKSPLKIIKFTGYTLICLVILTVESMFA